MRLEGDLLKQTKLSPDDDYLPIFVNSYKSKNCWGRAYWGSRSGTIFLPNVYESALEHEDSVLTAFTIYFLEIYFHEFLHLFLKFRLGKWMNSEKSVIYPLAKALRLATCDETDLGLVWIEMFRDVAGHSGCPHYIVSDSPDLFIRGGCSLGLNKGICRAQCPSFLTYISTGTFPETKLIKKIPDRPDQSSDRDSFIIPVKKIVFGDWFRLWCLFPYPRHLDGCPNYGKKERCPPSAPLFEDVIDLSRYKETHRSGSLDHPMYVYELRDGADPDLWLVVKTFDLKAQCDSMLEKFKGWSEAQGRCVLYWQKRFDKALRSAAEKFRWTLPFPTVLLGIPEANGVNLFATCRHNGLVLESYPWWNIQKMMLVGKPKQSRT